MSALFGVFKLHYVDCENHTKKVIQMIHRNQARVNFNTSFLLQKYCWREMAQNKMYKWQDAVTLCTTMWKSKCH